MIHDILAQFCNAQAAAATAGTPLLLGSQIDLKAAGINISGGKPVWLVCLVTTAVVAAGAGTVELRLMSDDSASINVSTGTMHARSLSITTANNATTLPAGTMLWVQPLPSHQTYEQFLGIVISATTQNISSGNIDAFLTEDVSYWKAYRDAI